jgi:hypothetical protein
MGAKINLKIMLVCTIFLFAVILLLSLTSAATPQGPAQVNNTANSTKSSSSNPYQFNISGGYISTLNMSLKMQDVKWKAFIGDVSGKFTLDDASGSTIFDWTLSTTNGKVFATRNDSTINWANINCSNLSLMEEENYEINHTNRDDNITKTFNNRTHSEFTVSTATIYADSCPTVHAYVNNATSNKFQEMVLSDKISTVFATILEQNEVGYNGVRYDFQMIVPENGASIFTGWTPYYIYVEIT